MELRAGNVIPTVNDKAADSPEVFRRRHIAWEVDITFRLQRGGKEMQVQIPRLLWQ